MRFVDIVSDIETMAALGTTRRAAMKRSVQQGLFVYAGAYDWPHYRDLGTLITVDDYTTGTVTVTNASKTVTGSGTTFTAAMVGRKLRVSTSNHFYFIATFVSATEVTLRDAYQGDTESGASYTIFQDEYRLDADTHKLLDIRQVQDSLMLIGLSYLDMDRWFPDPDQLNDPTYFSLIGRRDERYTTGTVATTAGSRTLTGTSTAWDTVPGLTRGTRLAVTDTGEVFTVDTVDSSTQITAYEQAVTTDASSTYRAFMNNLVVQFRDVPDAGRLLYYRKQRLPFPLVRDEDEPDMPREYHHHLVWYGLISAFTLLGNASAAQEAERRWNDLLALQRQQIGQDSPAIDYPRRSVDTDQTLGLGQFRLSVNQGYPLWVD